MAQSFICVDVTALRLKASQISSHEVGVLESVALFETLQLTPEQLVVLGISEVKDEYIEKIIKLFPTH